MARDGDSSPSSKDDGAFAFEFVDSVIIVVEFTQNFSRVLAERGRRALDVPGALSKMEGHAETKARPSKDARRESKETTRQKETTPVRRTQKQSEAKAQEEEKPRGEKEKAA